MKLFPLFNKNKKSFKIIMDSKNEPQSKQSNKKGKNVYKALYQISKQKRNKIYQVNHQGEKQSAQPINMNIQSRKVVYVDGYINEEDSLENIQAQKNLTSQKKLSKNPSKNHVHIVDKKNNHNRMQSGSSQPKKRSHNRSHSCPFITPLQSSFSISNRAEKSKAIPYKKPYQGQSRRTLKKKSAQFYLKHQKHPNNLHRKDCENIQKPAHKNSNSHFSQESNTIIVHTLPIQQLSSMLYSSNSLNKKDLTDCGSQSLLAKQMFSIHNDIYFQTRLQQQIKMYNLNEEMQCLQRQTQNVKIKQDVLEKLANQFQMHRHMEECDKDDEDCDDSLLIHS